MTRMIERWFPCAEVSENSERGWGNGKAEKSLFPWFASRPLSQARAAVICSLLPWPEEDEEEQDRLKKLVRSSMTSYNASNAELKDTLLEYYPDGANICDPFSGRAMIPLEAARLNIQAYGIDYSPVVTLAGQLLADYPMRNWEQEPNLPFESWETYEADHFAEPRLVRDVNFVLRLVGDRYEETMDQFYPRVNSSRPWGYLWSVTLPCDNCGYRFPLTGSLKLRNPKVKKNPNINDPGQSYEIVADRDSGTFNTIIHDGPPVTLPTLVSVKGRRGKSGICCFCKHSHQLETLKRMMRDKLAEDTLLVVADHDIIYGKYYRVPSVEDLKGLTDVSEALKAEIDFGIGIPPVPNETLHKDLSSFIGPVGYGYTSYGQLCNDRQKLGFVRLARIINNLAEELVMAGVSTEYAAALTGYAASNLARRIKFSTRSATLQLPEQAVKHIYLNDSGISHSFDYFETGCGHGPGTWRSLERSTVRNLTRQFSRLKGQPAVIDRGSAMELAVPDGSLDAVVTDPPYDSMINYCDSSDLLFVWLKRALVTSHPWFGVTTDPDGLQEKTHEAVIKFGSVGDDHRTEEHYKSCITKAFDQAKRKIKSDGVVSIVFGHGDPAAWSRLLTAITDAGLVLTGSWPCSTEKGGKQTGRHIDTTVMMSCRPAARDRPDARMAKVDDELLEVIRERVPLWEADGMALADQMMASAGPAMETVGKYATIRNIDGTPVALDRYLPLARHYVQQVVDVRIDGLPLDTFDDRSQFALFWVRQHQRNLTAGSEIPWQKLASSIDDDAIHGLLHRDGKGFRLAYGREATATELTNESSIIDVCLAVAGDGQSVSDIGATLQRLERADDGLVWAAMSYLGGELTDADDDGRVWNWAVRNRAAITAHSETVAVEVEAEARVDQARQAQQVLL